MYKFTAHLVLRGYREPLDTYQSSDVSSIAQYILQIERYATKIDGVVVSTDDDRRYNSSRK